MGPGHLGGGSVHAGRPREVAMAQGERVRSASPQPTTRTLHVFTCMHRTLFTCPRSASQLLVGGRWGWSVGAFFRQEAVVQGLSSVSQNRQLDLLSK